MITELRLKRMIRVISGKLLIASVVGAVVLGTFGYALADTAETSSVQFKDVPQTYWGAEYIKFSASKSIIKGYQQNDGTYIFAPESAVTYEEAATMLYRALNAAGDLQSTQDLQSEYASILTENKIADWAKPTVSYCLKNGIIDQSDLAVFTDDQGNGQKAPRLQVAIWAAKAMNKQITAAYSLPYSDVESITEKDLPYIDMLYRQGIMKGSLHADGTTAFLPQDGVKRAEFAAISNRIYDAMNSAKAAGTSGNYDVAKETADYRGQVLSVDAAKSSIQMKDSVSGLTRSIYIAPDAVLLVNGEVISSGVTGIKSSVEGKTIIVSTLAGNAGTPIKQVHIDTQPSSLKGTIKSVDSVGTNKIIGVALEDKSAQNTYYLQDAKTTSTATLTTGTMIQFIADGIHLVEIK